MSKIVIAPSLVGTNTITQDQEYIVFFNDTNGKQTQQVCTYKDLCQFAEALEEKTKSSRKHPFPAFTNDSFAYEKYNKWFAGFSKQNNLTSKEIKKIFKTAAKPKQKRGSRLNFPSPTSSHKDFGKKIMMSLGRTKSASEGVGGHERNFLKVPDSPVHTPMKVQKAQKARSFNELTSRLEVTAAETGSIFGSSPLKSTNLKCKEESDSYSTEDSEEFEYKTIPSTDKDAVLVASAMEAMGTFMLKESLVERIMKDFITYCDCDNLYLIRTSPDKNELVLDAIMTKTQTWSLMKSVGISKKKQKEEFRGLAKSQKTRRTIYIKDIRDDCFTKASILCIPIVLGPKYFGSLYLVHNSKASHFDNVQVPVLTMILINLFILLGDRPAIEKFDTPRTQITMPCLRNLEKISLQDSLFVYDPQFKKWNLSFVVLADNNLMIFSSSNDNHPKNQVYVNTIKKIKMTNFKNGEKEFVSFPTSSKKVLQSTLLYIQGIGKILWIACELTDTANDWKKNIENLRHNQKKILVIPANIRINCEEVIKGKIIGQGAAAIVYEGTFQQTKVAVKQIMDQFDESEVSAFFHEMNILQNLHHPNIVNLFGGFISEEEKPSIVFEFAMRGSLSTVLYDPLVELNNEMKLRILVQSAQALTYLHSFDPPIIHRDLKPANILINEDWTAKLADFGLARVYSDEMTNGQGTVKWMAPEILSNAPYTTKSDIYSFGLIIWEVIMQKPFFEEYKFNSQIEIQVVNHNTRPPISSFTPIMQKTISRCWAPDPDERATASILSNLLSGMSPADLDTHREEN